MLPERADKKAVHHAAYPYSQVNRPVQDLTASSLSEPLKLAADFTVLTAARSTEARGPLKSEIDFDNKKWTIQHTRKKMAVTHTNSLSTRALEILRRAFALNPKS